MELIMVAGIAIMTVLFAALIGDELKKTWSLHAAIRRLRREIAMVERGHPEDYDKREDEAPRDPLAPELRQIVPRAEFAEEPHEPWDRDGRPGPPEDEEFVSGIDDLKLPKEKGE